ncbi:hypothetical protein FQN55_002894 [Onygenales sp. PD_40]|nr:hypothetical protein FQN55_002894 [Onygenales sp. PD_40]
MSSNEIDYSHLLRQNQWPSTVISPLEFPPATTGGNIQTNHFGSEKGADEGNVTAGNGIGTMDSMALKVWSPETRSDRTNSIRPRPIQENVYSLPYTPNSPKLSTWNTYGIRMPSQYFMPPDFGTTHGLLGTNSIDDGFDEQNLVEGLSTFTGIDSDLPIFPTEIPPADNPSIGNERKHHHPPDHQPLTLDTNVTRPLSDSYFSLSSNTASLDFTDLSAFSEVPAFTPDYTPRSSLNLSSTPLSPVPSPRHTQSELLRGTNRPRASPSPRSSIRAPPYTFDGVRKRWSTGSYGSRPNRVTSPFLSQSHVSLSRLPSPSMRQNRLLPSTSSARQQTGNRNSVHFQQANILLPSNFDANARFRNPAPLASQGLFRTLQSDIDPHHHYFDHYSEFPSPPDLLGPLKEDPIPPPPEDMMPHDPSLVPHEQDLRFENDLYTPRWVRGHGNKREGWCGICKPGRWLVLKNSAFWYDKSFTHGISAATGQAFTPPKETRRTEGNTNVWEGLCGNCGEWVALVSSKKKGTTWFRHAYKCHNNQKNETLKRRRESTPNNGRPLIAESHPKSSPAGAQSKVEAMTPMGPPAPGGDLGKEGVLQGAQTVSPLHTIATMI